jgi:hypothetical protein
MRVVVVAKTDLSESQSEESLVFKQETLACLKIDV